MTEFKKIIVGTGHRILPSDALGSKTWRPAAIARLQAELLFSEADLVISGGAVGWDMLIAEAALYAEIPFDLYLPFPDSGSSFSVMDRLRLAVLKDAARTIRYTADKYYKRVFLDRDKEMVDGGTEVWAYLAPNTFKGGTLYTCNYAKSIGCPITNFYDMLEH